MRRIFVIGSLMLCSACGSADSEPSSSLIEDTVVGVTSTMIGMRIEAIPPEGCGDDVLSQERVASIISGMSAEQQASINEMLEVSSSFVTVELYKGELGTGFCLPEKGKLLLLPSVLQKATDDLAAVRRQAGI